MSLRAFHLDKYPFLPHFLFKTHFGLKFRLIRTWIFPKGANGTGSARGVGRGLTCFMEKAPGEEKKGG